MYPEMHIRIVKACGCRALHKKGGETLNVAHLVVLGNQRCSEITTNNVEEAVEYRIPDKNSEWEQ